MPKWTLTQYLVKFNHYIIVGLWTFQPTLVILQEIRNLYQVFNHSDMFKTTHGASFCMQINFQWPSIELYHISFIPNSTVFITESPPGPFQKPLTSELECPTGWTRYSFPFLDIEDCTVYRAHRHLRPPTNFAPEGKKKKVLPRLHSHHSFSQDIRIGYPNIHIWGKLDVQFLFISLHYTQKIWILGGPKISNRVSKRNSNTPLAIGLTHTQFLKL